MAPKPAFLAGWPQAELPTTSTCLPRVAATFFFPSQHHHTKHNTTRKCLESSSPRPPFSSTRPRATPFRWRSWPKQTVSQRNPGRWRHMLCSESGRGFTSDCTEKDSLTAAALSAGTALGRLVLTFAGVASDKTYVAIKVGRLQRYGKECSLTLCRARSTMLPETLRTPPESPTTVSRQLLQRRQTTADSDSFRWQGRLARSRNDLNQGRRRRCRLEHSGR